MTGRTALSRAAAERELSEKRLQYLSDGECIEILVEYWHDWSVEEFKEEIRVGEFPEVPDGLLALIASTEEPPAPLPPGIEPLLLDWLRFELRYARNDYVEKALAVFGREVLIDGAPRAAGECPCCHYLSIDPGEDGICDICPVCFWENFGDGPNHMTLVEAQASFQRIGAISEDALSGIEADGQDKYAVAGVGPQLG